MHPSTTTKQPITLALYAGIDDIDPIEHEVNGFSKSAGFDRIGVDPTAMSRPSKTDLYSEDELFNLLQLHQNLQESTPEARPKEEEESIIPPSLHDMILKTVAEIDDVINSSEDKETEETNTTPANFVMNQAIRDTIPNIRAIASDLDGTILSSKHTLHPTTRDAIKLAVEAALSPTERLEHFFLATGKSRAGALASVGPETAALLSKTPGVFVQGLYCVDGQGNVVFEKKLARAQIEAVEQLSQHYGVTLVGYDGDNLFATKSSDPKDLATIHDRWGEPVPVVLDSLVAYEPGLHKVFLMNDDPERISYIRNPMEALAAAIGAEITQAVPTILECLPSGCSKAVGVQELCKALGIDPSTQLLAVGDAENDLGMLELAAIGIAVGNASPAVKTAADLVMKETNDEGGAGVAIEQYGLGKALD